MKTNKNKNLKKANQGPVPQKSYKANKGAEPSMGDEGGVPGSFPNNNPKKPERKK